MPQDHSTLRSTPLPELSTDSQQPSDQKSKNVCSACLSHYPVNAT